MDPTRARKLRRRLWGLAFLVAVGLLVWQTLGGHQQIRVTLVLELGAAEPQVSRIEGELLAGDDVVGTFSRVRGPSAPIGAPRLTVTVPAERITVVARLFADGRVVEARRKIIAEAGATIYLPLERELVAPSAP